jgi:hypothetical protein
MPQKSRRAYKGARRGRSRADRLVTITVVIFLVLVIGGAVTLQLTANPGTSPTPQASAQLLVTSVPADSIQRIAADKAKQMLDAGQAVLIDIRSAQSYQ